MRRALITVHDGELERAIAEYARVVALVELCLRLYMGRTMMLSHNFNKF